MSGLVNKIQDKISGDSGSKQASHTTNQGRSQGGAGGYGSNYNEGTYGNETGDHYNTGSRNDAAYHDDSLGSNQYGSNQPSGGNRYASNDEYGVGDKDDWNRASNSQTYDDSQYGPQGANQGFRNAEEDQGTYGTTQGRTTRSQARKATTDTGELDDPMYDSVRNNQGSKW